MTDFLINLTFWHWLIFGGALIIVEMLAPSTLFLWPGVSALFVGLLKLLIPGMGWPVSVTIWAILSVITVVGWLKYKKSHPSAKPADTELNQRGQQYVGHSYILTKPLENGKGEIKAGDTVWQVMGSDTLPAGAKVKVTGADGTRLMVERA